MSNNNSTTRNLSVAYLDFDSIKASLRDYLRSQTNFTDYSFEGSGMSVLLDILAYNTHFFGFYFSMIANEMFLDSANLRSSVVSLAKMLGYTPRSITSSQATISATITPNDNATAMVIQKYTSFNTAVDGINYNFLTTSAYGATLANNQFYFPEIQLIEGRAYTYQITANSSIPNQRFIIPNSSVDTTSLVVRIQNSTTDSTTTTFVLADNLLEITATTNVYFLQEVENQQFQIIFGDGVIGTPVIDGNIVIISYVLSSGSTANGANIFTPSTPLGGYPSNLTTITTLVPSAGGLDAETTDEIKFTAPKNYEAQGRAVTTSDYDLLITQNYTNADSIAVWGGEDNVPPMYGKVFISIKPVNGFVITETAKELIIENILRKRNIVSIIPEIIDPDYTFVTVTSTVKYNPANTTLSLGSIQTAAYNAIIAFAEINVDKFNLELHYSQLLTVIDSSDPSIISNLTSLQMKKIFAPQLNVSQNYTLYYYNAIEPETLSSSTFVTVTDPLLSIPYTSSTLYTFADDGLGNVNLMQQGTGIVSSIARKNCGSVDYVTGVITLTQIIPNQGDINGNISLIVAPQENDIIPVRNNILFINPVDVNVTVIASSL